MNNMTENIMKDGRSTRKAKYNMVCSIVGGILILLGIMFLLVKAISVEYVDAQGLLHEKFFLMPMGFLCVFSGLTFFTIAVISALINKSKK